MQYFRPTPFDPDLVGRCASASQPAGQPSSPAPDDAVYMASVTPTAMIFVPCKDGVSHNEIEDAQPQHLEAGCNVLLDAMVARAGRSGS